MILKQPSLAYIQSCYTSCRQCGCYLLTTSQAIEQKFGKMSFVQGHRLVQPSLLTSSPLASFILIFVIRQSCRMSSMLLLVTLGNDGGGRSWHDTYGPLESSGRAGCGWDLGQARGGWGCSLLESSAQDAWCCCYLLGHSEVK